MTWDFFTEEEHDFFHRQKERIEHELSIEENAEIRDLYFGVADEDAATSWAIKYMTENAEKVAKFWNSLSIAIQEFYEKNGVDIS